MDICIPKRILVQSNFLSATEVLREYLEKMMMDKKTYEHQGTWNINYEHFDPEIKHLIEGVHSKLIEMSQRLMQTDKPVYINYTDLTYRPAFTGMGRHNDTDWYPMRYTTAVIPLNSLKRGGGHSVVEIDGVQQRIPAECGNLLLFPSDFYHWVEPAWEPRSVVIVWLTQDAGSQQKGWAN